MARVLEHEAKALLAGRGLTVPAGVVVTDQEPEPEALSGLQAPFMVKALVPRGKKGKAGLVVPAEDETRAIALAGRFLGRVNQGFAIDRVLIEERLDIVRELYFSITYDSLTRAPVVLFSALGGVDVEELAAERPEAMHSLELDPLEGFMPFQARELCFAAGLNKEETGLVSPTLTALVQSFVDLDARLLEVNPLALTSQGKVVTTGLLLNIDEEALFRHPELDGLIAYGQDRFMGRPSARERDVLKADMAAPGSGAVRYTEFPEGDIAFGVIGGGASLTALDAIIRLGGKPANYADLGPGKGSKAKGQALYRAILERPGIKAFITGANIIGAGMSTEIAANTARLLNLYGVNPAKTPVLARWAGLGEEETRQGFAKIKGVHYYGSEVTIEEAAEKLVELIRERETGEERP